MKEARILLAVPRAVGAILIARALPYSHDRWGTSYVDGGLNAIGFLIIFIIAGAAMGIAYFILGSVGQRLLRRKSIRYPLIVDAVLLITFLGASIYAGITATFTETGAANPSVQRIASPLRAPATR